MKIIELLCEEIHPDDIEAIAKMRDMRAARDSTLQLMFANARDANRRADLRQQVMRAGRVDQLVQQLWAMKLSNEGLPTGIKTQRLKKGIGYGT
jgi:hypothetical protein